ncbi:MAG TPA: dihydrolipoamide acetyltransferase family protein [Armatimonadota bacterium]|jgi:pyruvate dehydrogenase E2 component (dihydrolipoamide acetyltransferase)
MAQILTLPVLGQTMEEGTILKWFKREGEGVSAGEPLYEVMTDKVNQEVEAPESGTLLRILAPEDTTVPIRQPVAVLGSPGEDVDALLSSGAGASADMAATATGQAQPISTPTGLPSQLPSFPGSAGEEERVSPRARRLARDRDLDVGLLAGLGTGPGGRVLERDVQAYLASPTADKVRITPLAQRMAAERGLEPREILGSGPGGKVLRDDVERAGQPSLALPSLEDDERVPYTGMRKVIGDNLARSMQTAPHVTLVMEVDMTEAVSLRQQIAEEMERRSQRKATFTDLIARATALTLLDHRALNATFDGSTITRHSRVHLGIAVSLSEGLIVPVVRNAHLLGVAEISGAIRDLAGRAREGRLAPDDYTGGTFTITNLGAYGVGSFNPVINPPQCAILGVGGILERPGVVNGRLEPRSLMNLCLSFDHRLVDGAPAAAFLKQLKEILEAPYRLLI